MSTLPAQISEQARSRRRGGPDERGAALVMVLIMMIVGMILVGAILGFASNSLDVSGVGARRGQRGEVAEGAVKVAIGERKKLDPAVPCASVLTPTIGGQMLSVSCDKRVVPTQVANGAYGLVTTSLDPSVTPVESNRPLTINGNVFISGGEIDDMEITTAHEITLSRARTNPADLAERYRDEGNLDSCSDPRIIEAVQNSGATPPADVTCVDDPWWRRSGNWDPQASQWWYPSLAPVPTEVRSGAAFTTGGCSVYFPGRYNNLTIASGEHYFASGTYYFDGTLSITGGTVVGGAGTTIGCTFDNEAALNVQAPTTPAISGKGVQFVLGGAGRVSIEGSSTTVNFNRRYPGTLDNWSGGEATIISATHDVWTAMLETPQLWVGERMVPNPTGTGLIAEWGPISGHAVSTAAGTWVYSAPTLTVDDDAVVVDIEGTSIVRIGGRIVIPASGVRLVQDDDDARLAVEFGIVAHHVRFDIDDAANVWIGTPDKTVDITRFLFTATADGSTATGVLEYNSRGDSSVRSLDIGSE